MTLLTLRSAVYIIITDDRQSIGNYGNKLQLYISSDISNISSDSEHNTYIANIVTEHL